MTAKEKPEMSVRQVLSRLERVGRVADSNKAELDRTMGRLEELQKRLYRDFKLKNADEAEAEIERLSKELTATLAIIDQGIVDLEEELGIEEH